MKTILERVYVVIWAPFPASGKVNNWFISQEKNSFICNEMLESAPEIEYKIILMELSAYSPGLNPTENLWRYMVLNIYKNKTRSHTPRAIRELKLSLKKAPNL